MAQELETLLDETREDARIAGAGSSERIERLLQVNLS